MPRVKRSTRGHARPNPRGVLQVAAGGYGFVETPEGEFFIPASKLGGAFDGDMVEVKPVSVNYDRPQPGKEHNAVGKKPTARVVGVVSRAHETVVGRYEVAEPFGVVIPEDSRIQHDIFTMHAENPGVHDGDLVRVRILQYPARNAAATGKVEAVLGRAHTRGVEVDAIIAAHNLRTEFPPEALADASEARVDGDRALRDGYVDLRDRFVFTIDPADARDFDDAISFDRIDDGWRLGVHIADVSAYVHPGSALDTEARLRATSVYLVDRVIPMLPEVLSNGVCSLVPGEDRLCLTVDVLLDDAWSVRGVSFYPAVMRSDARVDYAWVQDVLDFAAQSGEGRCSCCPQRLGEEAPCSNSPRLVKCTPRALCRGLRPLGRPLGISVAAELRVASPPPAVATVSPVSGRVAGTSSLDGGDTPAQLLGGKSAGGCDLVERLVALRECTQGLKEARGRAGSLDLESAEVHVLLDEEDAPVGYAMRRSTEATELVEQCMILANTLVAQELERRGIPAIYRVHDAPDPAALGSLVPILQEFDYGAKVDLDAFAAGNVRAIQRVLSESRGRQEAELVSTMLLRAMKRASYAAECLPHFGLALEEYLHFTSPIRRYPDLVAHRALKRAFDMPGAVRVPGEGLKTLAEHASAMERTADEAAQQSQMLKLVEYLAGFVGQTFEGVISKVSTYGFFVRLDNTATGLVDLGSLGEPYSLDVRRQMLTGQDTGRVLRLGQRVRVVLVAARPTARQIDFELA